MQTLSIPQKDKIILAFGDVGRMLYDDPRRYTYEEVDQVLELFRERGYEVVPIQKPAPLALTGPAAPAQAPPAAAPKLSTNDQYWLETAVIPAYQHGKQNNLNGYTFKNATVGKLLDMLCKLTGVPFTK